MKQTVILFGCIATLAATSHAVEIRNVTSNSVVFYDDFENLTITPSTANAYDGSVNADPIAKVGSWTVTEFNSGITNIGIIQVTTYTNAPAPVPYQGSRDLRIYRDATHDAHDLRANLTSVQATPGNLIHLSMRVYIPSSQDANIRGNWILVGSTLDFNSARAWLRNDGAGNVYGLGAGFAPSATVPYLTDTWQEWTMDYVVGASGFNFSIGGVSGSSATSVSSGSVYGAEFINGSNTPGAFFLDAPEPTSVALLALGGLMLLLRRK